MTEPDPYRGVGGAYVMVDGKRYPADQAPAPATKPNTGGKAEKPADETNSDGAAK